MADSELSLIPNDVIRSALRETVENHLKSKSYKINVKSASKDGESNFAGIVYRVSYCKEDDGKNKSESSKLILKIAPQNPNRRFQFQSRPMFLRETYMYNIVSF